MTPGTRPTLTTSYPPVGPEVYDALAAKWRCTRHEAKIRVMRLVCGDPAPSPETAR